MHIDMRHFDELDPNISQHILWDTLETLTPPGEDNAAQQQTRDQAVAGMLEGLTPANPLQAMVASHIVALHHGALGCYRWAMQTDPTTLAAARLRRDAMAMTRTMMSTVRELHRMQGHGAPPPQPVGPGVPEPQNAMPGGGAAAAPSIPPAPEPPNPMPGGPLPPDAPPPAEATAPSSHDLTRRTRGKTDWLSTPVAMRGLMSRDRRTLTDDELEARLKARATPDNPYDPSWRKIKPPPAAPYWEDLTPEERRARYGWRSEAEIAAERAAKAAAESDAAAAAANAAAEHPQGDPPMAA